MKTVVITGASSGIGLSTAQLFSQKGFHVFLLGRDTRRLSQVQKKLKKDSDFISADLADTKALLKAVQKIDSICEQKSLRLHTLVNNAGLYKSNSNFTNADDIWNEQFSVNLMGPVRLTQRLWPHLKKNKGTIINIASTLGLRPSARTSAYSSLKAALINWSQSLALEAAPHGVRVNCISPGIVETPIHNFAKLSAVEQKKVKAQYAQFQPMGRMGQPKEIAHAIFFLSHSDSAWTTGANLVVDGGIQILNT